MRKTLVIGASTNPERYSFKAITSLVKHGHEVKAYGLRAGEVEGVKIDTELVEYDDIDTVTLYVGAHNQAELYEYIINLEPSRVIFNPGTENQEFEHMLEHNGIDYEEACTLVLLGTGQYE